MPDSAAQHRQEQLLLRPALSDPGPVDFGSNVIVFDDTVSDILWQTGQILATQKTDQFGPTRKAFFFKKGVYKNLTVEIGYYTTVHGLGTFPDDVTIEGGVQSTGDTLHSNSALDNFWRGVENLAVVPPTNLSFNLWAVSQATYMRRVHIHGSLHLYDTDIGDGKNYSSGGFIADSVVDTSTNSTTQQQFLTRNTNVGNWPNGVWNMVFVGDKQEPLDAVSFGASGSNTTAQPFTEIDNTPVIREKPYLTLDDAGNYAVQVPVLANNTRGPTWNATQSGLAIPIPIDQFYIAKPQPGGADNAANINKQLAAGYHLILTPGIYLLASSLKVDRPGTCILGLGVATLTPTTNTPAMEIADVDGVSVCGILFDAGPQNSPSLLVVGAGKTNVSHATNPTALFDVSCRVGGATPTAQTDNCVTINSNDVLIDNIWIWRADHGQSDAWVGWGVNPSNNGITVNGDRVTAYGLFVEHHEKYQTTWNGEDGSTYFYQSEIPYDVPTQSAWIGSKGENGFASYQVSDNVKRHTAKGVGIYSFFKNPNIQLDNAIITPDSDGIQMHHMITVGIPTSAANTFINHIINGEGGTVSGQNNKLQTASLNNN